MVFLKLDVSCVLAASPMERCFGPKPTSDLESLESVHNVNEGTTRTE